MTSPQLLAATDHSLSLLETYLPFNTGSIFVVPMLRTSYTITNSFITIVQYPIPSQQTVSTVANGTSNATKSMLRYERARERSFERSETSPLNLRWTSEFRVLSRSFSVAGSRCAFRTSICGLFRE